MCCRGASFLPCQLQFPTQGSGKPANGLPQGLPESWQVLLETAYSPSLGSIGRLELEKRRKASAAAVSEADARAEMRATQLRRGGREQLKLLRPRGRAIAFGCEFEMRQI